MSAPSAIRLLPLRHPGRRILYYYWITTLLFGLTRQLGLLLVVWVHGCIGLHQWLRIRPAYREAFPYLLGAAVAVPFLAVLGIVNAGWDTTLRATLHPDFVAAHGPPPAGTVGAAAAQVLERIWDDLRISYVVLVAAVVGARLVRDGTARRHRPLRVAYPQGVVATVPRGFSVLEASRWAGIPHASICGGRGRCSTCRIRILRASDPLPPPSDLEGRTLARVRAPDSVRLACQLRPQGEIAVAPLVPAKSPLRGFAIGPVDRQESAITALFIDLRNSTRLAAGRLPFDALFIVEAYVQRVAAATAAHGGVVTSVAGDGIMTVFGVRSPPSAPSGTRSNPSPPISPRSRPAARLRHRSSRRPRPGVVLLRERRDADVARPG